MNVIEDLAREFARFPGIGPRQAKRFVYYLLATSMSERARLAELVSTLSARVAQCPECYRFSTENYANVCRICGDSTRDASILMLVEKDQDLTAVERAGTYHGRYFVLGGTLTLSGKGEIRERELTSLIARRVQEDLKEIILALSATTEGEHTTDHVHGLLAPYRNQITVSTLGRGLATGSELEYSDAETLRAALAGRRDT